VRAVLALLLTIAAASAGDISIRLDGGVFRVAGSSINSEPAAGWESILAIYADSRSADAPPLLGAYSIENGSLVFRPRFPLAAGMHYRVVFHSPDGATATASFDGPKLDRTPVTRVEHVYPSIDALPENQLKFYLTFTSAMSRGEAWRRIHLMDDAGKEVELPFLELNQELWDPAFKRLTVLFDPGRIKRGLVPTNEVGPPLVMGHAYTLVIDADWKDARGVPMAAEFRKQFHVVAADRTPPDSKTWKLTAPKAGTRDPVIVNFGEPMDFALMTRVIEVPGVAGLSSPANNETEWRFIPAQPWKAGSFSVTVDTSLEDLAGNHVGRAFDVDTFDHVTDHVEKKIVTLPFRVR
jgi:hypothetical protein